MRGVDQCLIGLVGGGTGRLWSVTGNNMLLGGKGSKGRRGDVGDGGMYI